MTVSESAQPTRYRLLNSTDLPLSPPNFRYEVRQPQGPETDRATKKKSVDITTIPRSPHPASTSRRPSPVSLASPNELQKTLVPCCRPPRPPLPQPHLNSFYCFHLQQFRSLSTTTGVATLMHSPLPSWRDIALARSNVSLPWRSIQILVPHRLRRKIRSKLRNRQSPASSLSSLQTSFSPFDTLKSLQGHRWTIYDGQYLLLAFVGIFALCVIEVPGPLAKAGIATLLLTSLVLPITRQFFLPFIPIAAYLILFYSARYVNLAFGQTCCQSTDDRADSFLLKYVLPYGSKSYQHSRTYSMAQT